MSKLKYLIAGVLMCAVIHTYGHPLHLTFTNLEFKTQNSHWLLTIKVFTDEFTTNIKMPDGEGTFDRAKLKSGETEKILNNWLESKFVIWFDTKPIEISKWKFEGIKVKDDATWITYSISAPMPVAEIKIRNSLLLDLYPDQKNLFILVMGQTQSAYEFKNKDQETIIKLNK